MPPCRARRGGSAGVLQAIRVVVRADGAGAARAQPAAALRVARIALEFPQLAVAHVRDARCSARSTFRRRSESWRCPLRERRPLAPGEKAVAIASTRRPPASVVAEIFRKRLRERCSMCPWSLSGLRTSSGSWVAQADEVAFCSLSTSLDRAAPRRNVTQVTDCCGHTALFALAQDFRAGTPRFRNGMRQFVAARR